MASEEIAQQPTPRRGSGFAREGFWDEPDPKEPSLTRREAKRLWAKDAHEKGVFGGRQPGAGRPRNKTVAEYVAEEAAKKGDIVWRELYQMLQHKSPSIKLGAIDRIKGFEDSAQKNMRDDEKEIAKLGDEQVRKALLEELVGMGADVELDPSDVEEIEDEI